MRSFRSVVELRQAAEKAARMPSFENSFRNLYLNQRVNMVSAFVSPSVWKQGNQTPTDLEGAIYGGLDLSATTDLTSLVLTSRKDGLLNVHPYFWMPQDSVEEASKRDREPYDVWVKQGLIRTTPGKVIDYDFVARDIGQICSGLSIARIGFDRWRMDRLKGAMERQGVELPMQEFGQPRRQSAGYQMIEDENVKAFLANPRAGGRVGIETKAIISSLTTDADGSAGDLLDPMRLPIVPPVQRRMRIRDLLMKGRTSQPSIQYPKETGYTNSADTHTETAGTAKPQSEIKFDIVTTNVTTIAHWVLATRQILDDAPMLQSYIDGRLRYGLAFVEEDQLLNGGGTGTDLNGIYTQATASTANLAVVSAPTKMDVLRYAMLQASLAEFPADGIVIHPTDWAGIETTKDTAGAYIIGDPASSLQPRLWGLPVVATQAMALDKFLVGSFGMAAQIFDREDARVSETTTVRIARTFNDMAQDVIDSLNQLSNSIRGGGFLDILTGVVGLGLQLGGAGLFGKKIAANINRVPAFATGTKFAPGGLALVGERGPELVNLPRGSSVTPNNEIGGIGGIAQIVPSKYFDVVVDGRIYRAAPGIASAGASGGAARMSRTQQRRVA